MEAPSPPGPGRPADLEIEEQVLGFVHSKPGVGRAYIAAVLRVAESNVQRVLERHDLTTLNERLRFAGFDPAEEVPSCLTAARKRYKVRFQPCPGWLIHIDQKLLTSVRQGDAVLKVHAFAVVDNHSSYAAVHCAACKTSDEAATALRKFLTCAPFPVHRCLTDNGPEFKGVFQPLLAELHVDHRRIRPGEPWSNGKVERFNRTLREWTGNILARYQRRATFAQIAEAIDHCVAEYNRSPHFGKHNRGLSPLDCVEAHKLKTYDQFRSLLDNAACWVPKGYHLANRLVDERTGEVLDDDARQASGG
jgi:hypothetical protein